MRESSEAAFLAPEPGGRRSPRAKLPLIGAHLSTVGGFAPVPARARAIGAEVVQIFSSNPRTWRTRAPSPEELQALTSGLRQHGLPLFFHTIYLINLASPDPLLRQRSGEALTHALVVGALANATGVITHVGSHKGEGFERAAAEVATTVQRAARAAGHNLAEQGGGLKLSPLLLENGTGAGATMAGRLEELAVLVEKLEQALEPTSPLPVGVCLDTAHLFVAGYPIHEPLGEEMLLDELQERSLLPKVALIHLNDSATRYGSGRDQHANPGEGCIGYAALSRIVRHPLLADIPFVLEVPGSAGHGPDAASLAVARAMREGAAAPPAAPARAAAHRLASE